jgi:hypothetical protein
MALSLIVILLSSMGALYILKKYKQRRKK